MGPVLQQQSSGEARAALAVELALTQRALASNPKSYASWHHRAWAVVQGGADLEAEMVLVRRYVLTSVEILTSLGSRASWR